MPVIWFAGGDTAVREKCGEIYSLLGHPCIFFNDLLLAQKKLLSGECPSALFVFLERNALQILEDLKSIRIRGAWQSLAILVVLPADQPELTARSLEIGVDGVISLPLTTEKVESGLQIALKRRKIFSSH